MLSMITTLLLGNHRISERSSSCKIIYQNLTEIDIHHKEFPLLLYTEKNNLDEMVEGETRAKGCISLEKAGGEITS